MWQPASIDGVALRHDVRTLHHVAQFADVAGPWIGAQLFQCLGCKPPGLPFLLANGAEEVIGQQRHVRQALTQRRHVDWKHVQPVQQVFAQPARCNGLMRQAVGGRDDSHIGFLALRGTDAHEAPRFQHPQQLDLQLQRHFGDFVQEQRAPAGALEKAQVLAVRAGEAALFVAENLALDQVG